MSEEKVVETEDKVVEQIEGEVPEYTDVEIEAMSYGWNPDGVEGKPNLSAEEFMGRKPIYDDLRQTKKEIRKLKDGINSLMQEREVIRKKAREDTIKELQRKKVEAMEEQDMERVMEIDDQILDEKAALITEGASAQPVDNPDFEDWIEDNSWYNQDMDMQDYANTIGAGISTRNPKMSRAEVYEKVTEAVKRQFPEKFGGGRRNQRPAVESATHGRHSRKKGYSVSDLPDDAKALMPSILRSTGMSEEDYLKSYFGS